MPVSRHIEIAYTAPDDVTADWFEDLLRRIVMDEPWGSWEDVERFLPDGHRLTDQVFSSEPAIPSPEPLVGPG